MTSTSSIRARCVYVKRGNVMEKWHTVVKSGQYKTMMYLTLLVSS